MTERRADDIKLANRLEEAEDQVEMETSWQGKKEMASEPHRKSSSCVTRLKCVSALVNKGGIHAPLLSVVAFDRAAFHREAGNLCFVNKNLVTKKLEGKQT